MQLCILFAIIASLAAPHFPPHEPSVGTEIGLCAVILSQMLVLVAAWGLAARTIADVQCQHFGHHRVIQRLERGKRLHLAILLSVHALVLTLFQWPQLVVRAAHGWLLIGQLAGLLPLVIALPSSWAIFFDAERRINPQLATVRRREYVGTLTRCLLALPLVPLLLMLAFAECIRLASPTLDAGPHAVAVRLVPLLVLLVFFPCLVRHIWKTRSLEDGTLRRHLQQRALQLGFRMRDILVWDTSEQSMNAAVCGVIAPFRYVLLSDRLLQELSVRDVEMVFLHEVAHANFRHSLKLMLIMVAMLGIAMGLAPFVPATSNAGRAAALALPIMATFVIVGRYARLFEIEADLWAATQSTKHRPDYLRALAHVTGRGDPRRASWLHPSYAQRCELVLADVSAAQTWLHNQLRITTIGLITLVTLAAALLGWWSFGTMAASLEAMPNCVPL